MFSFSMLGQANNIRVGKLLQVLKIHTICASIAYQGVYSRRTCNAGEV